MIKKNILIISDFLPTGGWGGGVIIRSLTKNYPPELSLFWSIPTSKTIDINNTCNNIKILDFRTVYFRGRGFSDVILKLEAEFFAYRFNKFLKSNNIDGLWIIIGTSYPQLYRLQTLIKKNHIPFHVSVHDDPILEMPSRKKKSAKIIFGNILKKAASIDVISHRMRLQYQNSYGVGSSVITRCIPADFPQNNKIEKDKINILMGGYGNASAPWPTPLFDAVEELNQIIPSRIHLFDSKLKKYENDNIKVYESVSEEEFNTILTTVNIGYACDDLHPENIKFAQLSLPTKIITYIGAGIPFLYHGPSDSTVGDLLKRHKTGIIIETNNTDDLKKGFLDLLSDYSAYQKNCKIARQELFSCEIVQNSFFGSFLEKKLV